MKRTPLETKILIAEHLEKANQLISAANTIIYDAGAEYYQSVAELRKAKNIINAELVKHFDYEARKK